MSPPQIEPRSWIASPWVKWSWLVVLAVIIGQNLDYHWRFLPTTTEGYSARGRADYNSNEFERSIRNFTKVIDRKPNEAEAYIWRGAGYAKLHDIVHAMPDLQRAIALRPDYTKAWAAYGDGLAAAWDPARAIDAYSKVLAKDPNYFRCYLERARCYYDCGMWDEARADLDMSVKALRDGAKISAILLRWPARAHKGDAYGGSVELEALMKEGVVRGDRFWMSAQFLTGQATESEYLAAMPKIKGTDEEAMTAEANYLAGVKRLVFGDPEGAVALMRNTLRTEADSSYAHDRARVELETLLLGFHPIAVAQPDAGMTVGSVVPGSAAEAAGIRTGSTLEAIDGTPATQHAVLELLANGKLGSTVELAMIVDGGRRGIVPLPFRLAPSEPTR
jgi:tetratricopeptide (TPR) repeat protein